MERYSIAMPAALKAGKEDWVQIQRWVERFVCGTSVMQNVVGNRDHPDGGKITQDQFDKSERVAQVCPFVRDSLDLDIFYIEESLLTEPNDIRKLLVSRIEPFIQLYPAFDPIANKAGRAPMPAGIKTTLLFFPKYESKTVGADPQIDQIYKWIIMSFVRRGCMLGQFYRGCAEPSLHNPNWRKVLTSPFLAFVLRYMQPHDKMFISPDSTGWPIYARLFPEHAKAVAP